MPTLTAVTLFINGLMLTIALGSLLVFVVLLQDSRRFLNNIFGVYIVAVVMWMSGSLLSRATLQITVDENLTRLGLWLLKFGFGAACISIHLFTAILTESRHRTFWLIFLFGLITLIIYEVFLTILEVPIEYNLSQGLLAYSFPQLSGLIYFVFSIGTIFLIWQNLTKIRQVSMRIGLAILVIGQILALISPRLRSLAVAEDAGGLATLIIIYAIVQSQVIEPLSGRTRQVKVVRDIGSAITNMQVENVLHTITIQATELLNVAGSAIYLRDGQTLVLKEVHRLPRKFIDTTQLSLGEGLVGTAAIRKQGILVNNYQREWKGQADIPLASATFGAVLCVPLLFGENVVGVLLVVEGLEGRLFDQEDMELLELLAPQAAVAITNNRLFIQERSLTSELATAKTQLETVLISTTNAVIAIDHQWQVIFANPAAVNLISPDNPELYLNGRSLVEFIKKEFLPQNPRNIVHSLRETGSYTYELSTNKRDYLCHITRFKRPNRGWVAVLNDITTLKEVDRLKSQMVRMTTHDLKNPLFAIMNYIELIQEDGESTFSDSMKRNTNAIWMQLERMQRLINGILDLERVESGITVMEACDLRHIANNAVNSVEGLAIRKNISLKTCFEENLPFVLGDPQQLGQAITNLLDNAIKFTPNNGTIEIGVQQSPEHNAVRLSIKDSGIGIPLEFQTQVFERFFRVKSGRTKDDIGSGLGLSLVKAIINHHKGEIWLESQENIGTTFYIELPVIKD